MAYFQAKIGWKRLRERKNKNYHSVSFQLDALESSRKGEVRCVSFKIKKIGGRSLRKRENKNYRSVSFLPDAS